MAARYHQILTSSGNQSDQWKLNTGFIRVMESQFRGGMENHGFLAGSYPAGIYLLKVNNKNTRARCEICSKLTIKTPERRQKLTIETLEQGVKYVQS